MNVNFREQTIVIVVVLVLAILSAAAIYWIGHSSGLEAQLDETYPMREWALVDSKTHAVVVSGTSRDCRVNYVLPGWTHRLYVTEPVED